MSTTAQKIEQEFKKLSVQELIVLHAHLTEILYAKENATGIDSAFLEDIRRRVEEIDSGKVVGIDAFEALKHM